MGCDLSQAPRAQKGNYNERHLHLQLRQQDHRRHQVRNQPCKQGHERKLKSTR